MNYNLPLLIKLVLIAFFKNLHVLQGSHSLDNKVFAQVVFRN